MSSASTDHWRRLGDVAPTALTQARLAVHWAAQAIGETGRRLLPAEPDECHANLLWDPAAGIFRGRELPSGCRVVLDVAGYVVGLLGAEGAMTHRWPLVGQTLDGLFGGLTEALAQAGESWSGQGLARPDFELPHHSVADGGPFPVVDPAPLAELASWFHNAFLALSRVADSDERASEVRCWPHHFDLATLLTLDPDADDAESARSIGVGLSPGDSSYAQPYFYITPWPYPDGRSAPDLPGGAVWHTEGFFAAILTGDHVVRADDPRGLVDSVVEAALARCFEMLDAEPRPT